MSFNKLALLLLFIIAILVTVSKLFSLSSARFTDFFENQSLKRVVQKNIAGKRGEFAIVIESLGSDMGRKYSFNSRISHPPASFYKLVLLAVVFKQIEEGKLKPDDKMAASKKHLMEVLGHLDFGYDSSVQEIEYTVSEALERIGRISDNFAAIMLTEKVREGTLEDPLSAMAQELGMSSTKLTGDDLVTNASDIALFLKKLYQGQIKSLTISAEIIEILGLGKINDRIPAKLPKDVRVVHKTGELPGVRHDAGIVYPSADSVEVTPYVIVLMSRDLQYEDEGVEVLANISKDVYDYFNKQSF